MTDFENMDTMEKIFVIAYLGWHKGLSDEEKKQSYAQKFTMFLAELREACDMVLDEGIENILENFDG